LCLQKVWKRLEGMLKFLDFAEIFEALHPDSEKSQILFILAA